MARAETVQGDPAHAPESLQPGGNPAQSVNIVNHVSEDEEPVTSIESFGDPSSELTVFFSHSWSDMLDEPKRLVQVLPDHGLKVWADFEGVPLTAGISAQVAEHLAASKFFVAYYSLDYPTRPRVSGNFAWPLACLASTRSISLE
jgi:hypothetical protein